MRDGCLGGEIINRIQENWFYLGLPNWVWMWFIALGIFSVCKWWSWRSVRDEIQQVTRGRVFAYLFAWPGMDAKSFCDSKNRIEKPQKKEWAFAWMKTLFGVFMFWIAPNIMNASDALIRGWIGMVGLIFLLHFGSFHLIALFWRSVGVNAQPIMDAPIKAESLGEFWGSRWNLGFRQLTYDFIYAPVRKHSSKTLALAISFIVSGLIHELVISVPANAGYGLPTVYFVIQGLGILMERSQLGKRLKMGMGWQGRLVTLVFTVAPVFFLFQPTFVTRVILPFMQATLLF